eukprot:SAG31_NODE_19161_length_610_cov_1.273973_1_plen_26_part_10
MREHADPENRGRIRIEFGVLNLVLVY